MTAAQRDVPTAGETQAEAEGLTRYVADFVAGTTLEALPQVVVDNGKKSILDGLGLALSGSVAKSGELVRRHLAELNLGDGPATVIGSGLKGAPRFSPLATGVGISAPHHDATPPAVHPDH